MSGGRVQVGGKSGRYFQRRGKGVYMVEYWGPKANGTLGQILESAKADDEAKPADF